MLGQRWIHDLNSLNRRGWMLMREAARLDLKLAALQFGVSRRLIHRIARLPPPAIQLLSRVPVAQFVPADRDLLFAFLNDPAFVPPSIGSRDLAMDEREFNLHYWHTLRAQCEQDLVQASVQFNLPRRLLPLLRDASIDRMEALILGLRPEFRVVDVQNIEVIAMLIEAEASEQEVQHLLFCSTTASPFDLERMQ